MTTTEWLRHLEETSRRWLAPDLGGIPQLEDPDGKIHEDYYLATALVPVIPHETP